MNQSQVIFKAALTLAFSGCLFITQAQKLKQVQEGNMRAPSNIKIDGKLSEWDDTFKAYNNTTDLFYTVSNDDNNLYFAIKTGNRIVTTKLLGGGISFAINTADQKKEKGVYTVVFPLIDPDSAQKQMGLPRFFVSGQAVMFNGPPPATRPAGFDNSPMTPGDMAIMTRRVNYASREIKLLNFPKTELPDSVISIYNELGIKAAIGVDPKGNLAVELAIPLKYLRLSVDNPTEFAYNLKLNGLTSTLAPPPYLSGGGPPPPPPPGAQRGDAMPDGGGGGMGPPPNLPSPADMRSMASSTDFWGKYILAKK